MRQRFSVARVAFCAVLTALVASQALAQQGRVSGLVKDEKDNPIKGATITAENQNIGSSFTATTDRKSTRLNSSHIQKSRMPSSA